MPSIEREPRSLTARLLARLDCRPIPIDRTGGASPFATSTAYASCPRCGRFAGIVLDDATGRWQSICGCFGLRPHDEIDLLMAVRHA